MSERMQTFEEFWPFYVKEHARPKTRRFHFVGTTAVIGLVGTAVLLRKAWPLMLAPIAGYGPAWVSHFFIEKNKPASFKYPLWSLIADFKMWGLIASGQMEAELARIYEADAKVTAEKPVEEEVASAMN
jgi:hypothetical protein